MPDARKYSDADVRAILDRALAGGSDTEALSHAELLSIGEQVGVRPEVLSRAAEEVQEERQRSAAESAVLARRRRWLGYHAALFALVNALAFAVNFFTTPGEWWSLFSIVPWAFALIAHAGATLALPASEGAVERERLRAKTKVQRRSAARLRVEATKTSEPATLEPDEEAVEAPRRTANHDPE